MSELVKTVVFSAVSLAVLGAGLLVRYWPSEITGLDGGEIKTLFKDFKDPLKARSLEISRYDDVTGKVKTFSVEQVQGRWVIPSHEKYPADADEQMKRAATSLIGLEVLGRESNMEGDHELYGVIEPDDQKLKPGAKGVGVMISMKDAKGDQLAGLIVGKKVKDNDGYRFVRVPGQSQVYVVEIDLEKLSTKFEDWIEKDLLQLNPLDIEKITFDDYSMETALDQRTRQLQIMRNRRLRMAVQDVSGRWQLDELLRFNKEQQPVKVPLASSEELNSAKLGELRTALDDLKIVDVRRKPEGLGADLKGDKGIRVSEESFTSLLDRGFFLFRGEGPDAPPEVLSRNGDLLVETKLGVEYLLRFGNLVPSQDPGQVEKLNRYLMVACRVAEDKFPEPKPPVLPEIPAGPEAPPKPSGAADKGTTEKDAADNDGTDKNAAEKDGADKDAAKKNAADKDVDSSQGAEDTGTATDAQADETNAEAQADDGKQDEAKPSDAKAAEEKPAEEKPVEIDRAKILAERDRLTKAYQRERDKWQEERKQAAEKVRELNARFADWYYVIPEDVYKKIHLGRAELITEKENVAEEGYDVDAFRHLEQEGLQVDQADDTHGAPGTPPFSLPGQ